MTRRCAWRISRAARIAAALCLASAAPLSLATAAPGGGSPRVSAPARAAAAAPLGALPAPLSPELVKSITAPPRLHQTLSDIAAVGVALPETQAKIAATDLRAHLAALAGEAMEGRMTGTPGGRAATAYVAALFERYGLEPAGADGSFFHPFAFPFGVALGGAARLSADLAGAERDFQLDRHWRPLGFSDSGVIPPRAVVFAGYGLSAPRDGDLPAYDSFAGDEADGASLVGKWALVWRGAPPEAGPERRAQLLRVAGMRYKASLAKSRGAAGLILAAGPGAGYAGELPPLRLAATGREAGLPVVAMSRAAAEALLGAGGLDPATEADALARGARPGPLKPLSGVRLGGEIQLRREIRRGRNVIGRLRLGGAETGEGASGAPVLIGAHIDHLGRGGEATSLARPNEAGMIHFGADDNASGVAALLEIAESLAAARAAGELAAPRDLLFAVWSAEELGLIGASRYVADLRAAAGAETLAGVLSAYLNMDMVGRLRDRVELAGMGSSPVWRAEAARAAAATGLEITLLDDVYLPTDATAFYLAGAPILSATTGTHPEYHTPRDQAALINYEGLAQVSDLMRRVLLSRAQAEAEPPYVAIARPERRRARRRSGLFLGTIPDFAQRPEEPGVELAGVTPDGPAAAAGLKGGDRLLRLAGEELQTLYDLVRVLNALEPDRPVEAVVARGEKELFLEVTPRWRD